MNSDEFNDLEKFGKVIEKPTEKNIVKEKKKKDISLKISFKKIILKTLKRLFYLIKALAIEIKIMIERVLIFLKEKKEIRKRYKNVLKRNRKRNNIGYKIVETKKQRRNKTIIVRRRVPSYFDTTNLVARTNSMGNIYYLSLKEEVVENNNVNHESYNILKKSVWDFPAEDKSIFRRSSNILKIRGLLKK